MVSFYSDNTTGSAWVSSTKGFSLPHRAESLESPFLAGDYAKANKRRQKRDRRRAREMAKRAPRSFTEAPRQDAPPRQPTRTMNAQPVQQRQAPVRMPPQQGPGISQASTMTVGRLRGVTVSRDTSFFGRMSRTMQNFSNSRLTSVTNDSFPASSGFALDGVELTQDEYNAWIGGDPQANAQVVVVTEAPQQNPGR